MTPFQHLQLLLRYDRTFNIRQVIQRMVRRGDRVLDAGCGLGLLSQWAAAQGASVLAVDLDDVKLARELAAENGYADQIEFRRANLFDLVEEEPELAGSFDVILAMIYLNDPRRDESQSTLAFLLRDRFLKPGGKLMPDRVEYQAAACDWPSQDWQTRQAALRRDIQSITERYQTQFAALQRNLQSTAPLTFFPHREASGLLDRGDCRLLGAMQRAFQIDYAAAAIEYPAQLQLDISHAGVANAVLWYQKLMVGNELIFANESVGWIEHPQAVGRGDRLTLSLDSQWRKKNVLCIQ